MTDKFLPSRGGFTFFKKVAEKISITQIKVTHSHPTQAYFALSSGKRGYLRYRFGFVDIWFYQDVKLLEALLKESDFAKKVGDDYDGFMDLDTCLKYIKEALEKSTS